GPARREAGGGPMADTEGVHGRGVREADAQPQGEGSVVSEDHTGTRWGTRYPGIFAALAEPFPAGVVKQLNKGGRTFDFVDARVVMTRLDDVLGPENWWCDHREGTRGLITSLTIRLPDGSTVTKVDGGGFAGMTERGGETD